jgi:hypothetical protein
MGCRKKKLLGQCESHDKFLANKEVFDRLFLFAEIFVPSNDFACVERRFAAPLAIRICLTGRKDVHFCS